MIGAFKPSAPLSGGLLWKIPWRLSPPQKLRQRRRLRRVDNVVAVLSTALKKASISTSASAPSSADSIQTSPTSQASVSELSTTAEGRRLLASTSPLELRRHGRGPKQGDYVPVLTPHGVHTPGSKLLRDVVNEEGTLKRLERWRAAMPSEAEMPARDKYTIFDKKVKGYRKGVHKLPKWTRVSQRVNPPGF